jgi:hypothetical protein
MLVSRLSKLGPVVGPRLGPYPPGNRGHVIMSKKQVMHLPEFVSSKETCRILGVTSPHAVQMGR